MRDTKGNKEPAKGNKEPARLAATSGSLFSNFEGKYGNVNIKQVTKRLGVH